MANSKTGRQMYKGTAERVTMSFAEFPKALTKATEKQAFGYGQHSFEYPDKVSIVVAGKESPDKNIISRTQKFYAYTEGPGAGMFDHDPNKYGPVMSSVQLIQALIEIHPAIAQAARVVRGSVSAGIHKTGEIPRTDKGFHVYILVKNAADIPRYGNVLFDRLWINGLGFIALASNGALLVRTVIDGAVFSPERLDFVGKPIIEGEGLEYTPPKILYTEGDLLDTESLPDLTDDEQAAVKQLIADAKQAIKPEAANREKQWAGEKVEAMCVKGTPVEKAREVVNRILKGGCQDLYDDFILEFTTGPVSVADVMKNPAAFDGKALADPIEGTEYGRTTAMLYWNDGKPVIHSLAHGQNSKYFLHKEPDVKPAPKVEVIDCTEAEKIEMQSNGSGYQDIPDFPDEILNMPYGMGLIQKYVYGRMIYPSKAIAGVAASLIMTHFSQKNLTIKSYAGLGFNEQYMILAPTAFGKEAIRESTCALDERVNNTEKFYLRTPNDSISSLAFATPASQQGVHGLLLANRAQTILSDEHAEWPGHASNDGHKQQALGYIMQLYTKALGIVAPPNIADAKYPPVKHPRFTTMATSTIDAMVRIMTGDHARAGAFNRFVIAIADIKMEAKRYDGLNYDPDQDLIDLLEWVRAHDEASITFDKLAWDYFKEIDTEKAEKIKVIDPLMGGRLSEQAIKEAGRIALSDRRTVITKTDLEKAFEIRLGHYERAKYVFAHEFAMSDKHDTVVAKKQILRALRRNEKLYKSQFSAFSRKYDALSVNDQFSVVKSLLMDGSMSSPGGPAFISLVFRRKT